jgi:predicted DNA-binding protein
MTTAQINLTDSQTDALQKLSAQTGKTEDELLQEAVNKLISEVGEAEAKREKWLKSLRQAKGIWKDRDDLPDFRQLRSEWDRFSDWNNEK